jgi:hypothetical protein
MIATTQWNKEKFIGETVMINPVILKTSEEMVI